MNNIYKVKEASLMVEKKLIFLVLPYLGSVSIQTRMGEIVEFIKNILKSYVLS